ncbi:MAG: 2Fe-2S iron-sulfur cluster-binding protein [Pseudomonadota bacterium]
MPKIIFIEADKTEHSVDAEVGMTVMEVAVKNRIPGIDAECGGACSCATCHVYIADTWQKITGAAEDMEEDMLDFAFDVREQSRLSCQIQISEQMDGLTVHIPEKQF